MPRFFFHLTNGTTCTDEEGLILADADQAREEAIKGARDILADEVRHGRLPLRNRIEVADQARRPVLTLPFREAVEIEE